eukprot:jgi/Undpi1/13857/HiC_scaffold_9.g03508.m1
MADNTTTALYIVVLVGWFLLMCIVLRCCQENEAQSIFDLEHEINLSAFAELQPKPLVCVDGQPARFARVQPLDSISPRPSATGGASYSATVAGAASAAIRNKSGGAGADATLDRLEMPTAETALPSAEAVWSPILALRTFVEPLTTRASSALRSFHISFHGEGEVDAGTGEVCRREGEVGGGRGRGGRGRGHLLGWRRGGGGDEREKGGDRGRGGGGAVVVPAGAGAAVEEGRDHGGGGDGSSSGSLRREGSSCASTLTTAAAEEARMASDCAPRAEEAGLATAAAVTAAAVVFGHDRGEAGPLHLEGESKTMEVDVGFSPGLV